MSDLDKLVDAFVASVNAGERDLRLKDEVAPSVRVPSENEDYSSWTIVRCETPWLADLEQSLPARLPATFRSLISRYCFATIEVGPIVLHANTSEGTDFFDFRKRLVHDRYMSPFLLQHGFIHFAQPDDRSYDPVCFHVAARSKREYPIVRLDHEEILVRNRVRVTASIASSLRDVLEQFIRPLTNST